MKPVVGDPPDYDLGDDEIPWVLGTQLNEDVGPLGRAEDGSEVLMVESHDFADRKPYHSYKLTLVFSAMRMFRDRLSEKGYDVTYLKADTFGEALEEFFAENPDTVPVMMRSPSYGSAERFEEVAQDAGGDVRTVENELFVSTREAFDTWADETDSDPFRHETFYRWMRRRSGTLMDGDEPAGGDWNYDDENREYPPDDWDSPDGPDFDHGEVLEETMEWVGEEFDTWGNVGDPEEFPWPVTRKQALSALSVFVDERLSEFGTYQDAMVSEDWSVSHALLGSSINLGLLHPVEVIERVEESYHDGDTEAPINSVEGAIRQILGWREFMRHVYRHRMPDLATANQLGAEHELPDLYWTAETDMECLKGTVEGVRERGYSHHIQRLMILANFATLWGVEPKELNEWFHATYVDAYHWVTTPNVIEMGMYGDGVFATKPYVSSANYIDDMSDYCGSCPYYKTKDTGEGACPFNALYWDFLDRNEEKLRSNHRMGLMYSHVDDKQDSGEMEEIRERVEDIREMETEGSL
jgi:deoxyribodipyrimidine photolyase-related protein